MTAPVNDTIALADRIERGLLYLTGDGPLLESEHCLIVAALRANRAVADLEAENQELRVLLADERAAHRVCVEMRDEAERKSPARDKAIPVNEWKIVANEPVLIYVVHTNAEFEKDEKVRREKWENWTVGRWITHNGGGWTYYGMMGHVTHVAPLPPLPSAENR